MDDIRQSNEYSCYMSSQGWQTIKTNNTIAYSKKIPFFGTFIKIHRPKKISQKLIDKFEKLKNTFQIVVEPLNIEQENLLKSLNFKQIKTPYIPSKSLELNLSNSIEKIFNQLKKDCRYSIKKSSSIKLNILKTDEEILDFRNTWRSSLPIKRYVPSTKSITNLRDCFKKNCLILYSPKMKAGGVFLIAANKCYYWHGFTDKIGRKSLVQYQIIWQAILWAKKINVKIFDFEGLYDERFPNKDWIGFSHFKKSFGGNEINYPGGYQKSFGVFKLLAYLS